MALTLPFYIAEGDTTNDSKIEKNFEAVKTGVDSQDSSITTLNSNVSTLQGQMTTANNNISALQAGLSYIQTNLSSHFTSTTTSSFQDTGLKLTLPTAGTWLLLSDLRSGTSAATQYGLYRYYNQTTSTEYANTYRLSGYFAGSTVTSLQVTLPMTEIITTTTTNNIIGVELKPQGAYAISLFSDTNGYSSMKAIKIA